MVAIPYVSLTHRLARRLRLSSTRTIHDLYEDFYYQGDFRLYPKHLQGMESDNAVMDCIPDSSKLDNVIVLYMAKQRYPGRYLQIPSENPLGHPFG
jgi:hypothetical protein